jgi:hypothetical protein
MPYFKQAEILYELFTSIEEIPNMNLVNDQQNYLLRTVEESSNNRGAPQSTSFTFFLNGGVNKNRMEKQYTMTIFYLGQAYTQMNKIEQGVSYLSKTMLRQLEGNEYQVKDWVINNINLAEYFI